MPENNAETVRPYVNIVREDGTLAPDPYPLPGQRPGRKSLDATSAREAIKAEAEMQHATA